MDTEDDKHVKLLTEPVESSLRHCRSNKHQMTYSMWKDTEKNGFVEYVVLSHLN